MAKRRQSPPEDAPADRDPYPTVRKGIHRVLNEGNIPDVEIEFFECTFLASGEATYRYRTPRAEETDGGYLPGA